VGKRSADNILEVGEQALITVWVHDYDFDDPDLVWADGAIAEGFINTNVVDTYHTFTLEVKSPSGAVLTMQRTTPAVLDTVMDLH
jgi:archaellin